MQEGCEEEEDLQSDDIRSSKRVSQDITSTAGQRTSSADTGPGSGGLAILGSDGSLSMGHAGMMPFGNGGLARGSGSGRGRGRAGFGNHGLEGAVSSFLHSKPDTQRPGKAGKGDKRGRHMSLNRNRSLGSQYKPLPRVPPAQGAYSADRGDLGVPCLSLGMSPFDPMDSALPHVGRLQPAAGGLGALSAAAASGKALQASLPAITSPMAANFGGLHPLMACQQMWPGTEQAEFSGYMPALYEPAMSEKLIPPCTSQGMVLEAPSRNFAEVPGAAAGLCGEGQLPPVTIKIEGEPSGDMLHLPQAFADVNNSTRWVLVPVQGCVRGLKLLGGSSVYQDTHI